MLFGSVARRVIESDTDSTYAESQPGAKIGTSKYRTSAGVPAP